MEEHGEERASAEEEEAFEESYDEEAEDNDVEGKEGPSSGSGSGSGSGGGEEETFDDVVLEVDATGEINTTSFTELNVSEAWAQEAQEAWRTFVNQAASRESAADALYSSFFEASPSLQSLFVTPRAIAAGKFFSCLAQYVGLLSDPPALKTAVEVLAFGHLALEVTPPRVILFRDSLLDLFQVELGAKFTTEASMCWKALLNYVGGAIIYIKSFYNGRIKLLDESWAIANDTSKESGTILGSMEESIAKAKETQEKDVTDEEKEDTETLGGSSLGQKVPTTFKEMFQFNAAVMGFGASIWMNEVLACFDNIVKAVSNPTRLTEECDVLVCRISRVSTGKVVLAEFKSGMLASLRSLLPKDWTTQHEVAWSWLWELVERAVSENLGNPPRWERAYANFLDSIDESTGFNLRRDIYLNFFQKAPGGQDYFKQSNTYLHLVSTKVLTMVLDMYRDPIRMVDDISSVGLRHVGYGIPAEFFAPFASSTVEVVAGLTSDVECIEGFKWSLGLIAKSTVRVLNEGSTIVMKAINVNSKHSMMKALSVAPRGERFRWMLLIQVGSQNISPLAWSIESGSLEAASTMLKDLLTLRADREKYYYGADDVFKRHPKIIAMLLSDAPSLVPELLDGLIWRSRLTRNGFRRVNYFVRHLIVDAEGKFANTLEWIVRAKDPKIVCHPVMVLLSDVVWTRVACTSFLFRKSRFVFTLIVFILGQSVLPHISTSDEAAKRYAVFAFRSLIYTFSLGYMVFNHCKRSTRAYVTRSTKYLIKYLPVPNYLQNWQEVTNLLLMCMLVCMLATDPIINCLGQDDDRLFEETCENAKTLKEVNSQFSMLSMFLYWVHCIDLAVFNNRVSAYVLVCGRMLSEVTLFLLMNFAVLTASAAGVSCLDQPLSDFHGLHMSASTLWEIAFKLFDSSGYARVRTSGIIWLFMVVFLLAIIFLMNLLIAQLTCAYDAIYLDMVGYARIQRIRIIVESMPQVTPKRWQSFLDGLAFHNRIEFNDGDVGLANGIATKEAAVANPTTVDVIKRFGGSTSSDVQWPEDTSNDDEGDKFERLEALIKRTMERITVVSGGGGSSRRKGTGSALGASGATQSSNANGSEDRDEE